MQRSVSIFVACPHWFAPFGYTLNLVQIDLAAKDHCLLDMTNCSKNTPSPCLKQHPWKSKTAIITTLAWCWYVSGIKSTLKMHASWAPWNLLPALSKLPEPTKIPVPLGLASWRLGCGWKSMGMIGWPPYFFVEDGCCGFGDGGWLAYYSYEEKLFGLLEGTRFWTPDSSKARWRLWPRGGTSHPANKSGGGCFFALGRLFWCWWVVGAWCVLFWMFLFFSVVFFTFFVLFEGIVGKIGYKMHCCQSSNTSAPNDSEETTLVLWSFYMRFLQIEKTPGKNPGTPSFCPKLQGKYIWLWVKTPVPQHPKSLLDSLGRVTPKKVP